MIRPCIALIALMLVLGCASLPTPAERLDLRAADAGYQQQVLQGGGFHHVAYARAYSGPVRRLHVYLEGDGLPWLGEGRVATDPHPLRPLAFELMELDSAPSLYLGRPCYSRWRETDPCNPLLWTLERYSPRVVEAMTEALRTVLAEQPAEEIVLVGYSGGGVLAMLLAEKLAKVSAVVTIAANLDVGAWAELHGYTPLLGSLDPARRAPLPAHVRQMHLVGEDDQEVPPELSRPFAERTSSEVRVIAGADHACCWEGGWAEVLGELGVE